MKEILKKIFLMEKANFILKTEDVIMEIGKITLWKEKVHLIGVMIVNI